MVRKIEDPNRLYEVALVTKINELVDVVNELIEKVAELKEEK